MKRTYRNSRTRIAGVSWNGKGRVFEAQFGPAVGNRYLGRTTDFFEACCLRKSAEAAQRRGEPQ